MRRITVVGMIILSLVAMPLVVSAKGGGDSKVIVCHFPNEGGDPHEITISDKAFGAHVGDDKHEGHGDLEGDCPDLDALPPVNMPPIAVIQFTSNCSPLIGTCVPLIDGTGSYDEYPEALTFSWTIEGPSGTSTSMYPVVGGLSSHIGDTFTVTLAVSDGEYTDSITGVYIAG